MPDIPTANIQGNPSSWFPAAPAAPTPTAGYASYSGFAGNPLALSGFSPEVVAALKANDTGQKNVIIGGQVVQRDPNFSFTPSSPVTTSTPVRGAVDNLGNGIAGTTNNPPTTTGYDSTADTAQKASDKAFYDARRQELATQRDQQVAQLNAGFDAEGKKLTTTQANETGTESAKLARIGGLGESASGQGALLTLESTHKDEVNALLAKRASAIQTAQNAFSDKDFALAQDQLNAAKAIDKQIYDRTQTYNDNVLKAKQEARAQAEADYNMGAAKRQQATDILKWARDNGLTGTSPAFEYGGHAYSATDGHMITDPAEAAKLGIKPDMSNVQVISPKKDYAAGSIGEYQYYVEQTLAAGKKPVDYMTYQDIDANRKARAAANTATDRNRATLQPIFDNADALFSKGDGPGGQKFITVDGKQQEVVGTDGGVNEDLYLKTRNKVPPDLVTEFDKRYGPRLEAKARARLGVGSFNVYAQP